MAGVISVPIIVAMLAVYTAMLGYSAFNLAPQDVFWLQVGYALIGGGVVLFEAIGAVLVRHLWQSRQYIIAVGGALCLIAAAVLAIRFEVAFYVQGQSDRIAEREASTERRETVKSDLSYWRAQRDEIGSVPAPEAVKADLEAYEQHRRWDSTAECTDATVTKSITFCQKYHALEAQLASAQKLEKINAKIDELEEQRSWVPVNAGGSPDAAWASRVFSGEESVWRDLIMVVGIAFGFLFRLFALAMAYGSIEGMRRRSVPSPTQSETVDVTPDETVVLLSEKLKEQRGDKPEDKGPVQAVLATVSDSEISYPDLSNRVNRECLKRGVGRMSSRVLGETMRDLGYEKFKVRDPETGADVTWYDLGSGGAQAELANAA